MHTYRSQKIIAAIWGILCNLAFIIGVAMMIWSLYNGMQTGWGKLDGAWRWIANTALLLQFPTLHSLLLTSRGRGWLKRLAPAGLGEPLSTTTYVLISSLQVMLLFGLWSPTGIVWWQAEGWTSVLLTLLYIIAWLLVLKSIIDAGFGLHSGSLGWRAVWKAQKPVYPAMPSAGLFRYCRQPIYASFALTVWTAPVWTPDQLFVAVTLTAYCLIGPLFKEQRFNKMYQTEFVEYQRRVPYWLPWPPRRGANVKR
jgi:protein-S-isoprenylcysteine O-methyltransferase Ste14